MECVQIKVTSSGSVELPAGVAIPGTYSPTDPGILVNIYPTPSEYTIPGPAVWDGASSGSGSTPASSKAASSAAPAATSKTAATSAAPAQTSVVQDVATSAAAAPSSAAPVATSAPVASNPTTLVTSVKPVATGTSGAVQKWGQCGGMNYSGATGCADGWVCKEWNPYYSQCIESA